MMTGNGISVCTMNHLRHCTYKDDIKQTKTGIEKKDDWTKTRCARPSLTGVGHRDLGWTLLGQGVFGTAELRHPSCAKLGICILRCAGFLGCDVT